MVVDPELSAAILKGWRHVPQPSMDPETSLRYEFVRGFAAAIDLADRLYPGAGDEMERALRSGPETPSGAPEEANVALRAPDEAPRASDADGIDVVERAALRRKFDDLYRQAKLSTTIDAPAPSGETRHPYVLAARYPGIERQAVRLMHDRFHEFGPTEFRLLQFFFTSGGTVEELRALPAPSDYSP